jgi:hypothetical protein
VLRGEGTRAWERRHAGGGEETSTRDQRGQVHIERPHPPLSVKEDRASRLLLPAAARSSSLAPTSAIARQWQRRLRGPSDGIAGRTRTLVADSPPWCCQAVTASLPPLLPRCRRPAGDDSRGRRGAPTRGDWNDEPALDDTAHRRRRQCALPSRRVQVTAPFFPLRAFGRSHSPSSPRLASPRQQPSGSDDHPHRRHTASVTPTHLVTATIVTADAGVRLRPRCSLAFAMARSTPDPARAKPDRQTYETGQKGSGGKRRTNTRSKVTTECKGHSIALETSGGRACPRKCVIS